MGKLIKTNHWQQKTRGFNGDHKSMSGSLRIEENSHELDKLARKSFCYAMSILYNDLGHYGMTIDEHKPMSEDLNKKLNMRVIVSPTK